MKKMIIAMFGILAIVSVAQVSDAQLINQARRAKRLGSTTNANPPADKASSANAQAEKPLPFWVETPPKVTMKDEEKYDLNKDGILQTSEAKILLREALAVIRDKGGITVNSGILKKYDKNRDNIVNKYESADIEADLQY